MHEEDELIQTFIEEASENFQVIEESLLDLENDPGDSDLINGLFRAMHTIKGSASLVGLEYYSELAHKLENVLSNVRKQESEVPDEVFSALFFGTDVLKQMMEAGDYTGESFQEQIQELNQKIEECEKHFSTSTSKDDSEEHKGEDSSAAATFFPEEDSGAEIFEGEKDGETHYLVLLKFHRDFLESGVDLMMWFMEMEEHGEIISTYLDTEDLPPLHDIDPSLLYIYWIVILKTPQSKEDIEEMFTFVSDQGDLTVKDITNELYYWMQSEKSLKELWEESSLEEEQEEAKEEEETTEAQPQPQAQSGVEQEQQDSQQKPQQKSSQSSAQRKAREQEQANTIRVDAYKLENILNEVAELLIAQSRVKELVLKESSQVSFDVDIYNAFDEVDKIIRYLQEEVMKASMVPIGGTFVKFQRMARDLAKELGKEMEMDISGRETELDKRVIEQMADPLKHIIRNTLDHGLEMPEEREQVGKPRVGTISLNAYHQEGNIVIEIKDDGKGIDKDKVLEKARNRGVIDDDYDIDDNRVYNLLFHPGFSTAEKVSDLSGRGVGLDVVQRNISNLRGSVEIESEKGKGTTFIIKLPLTLAIIDGMVIRLGEERLVLPLNSISEFLKAEEGDIFRAEGKGLILSLRDEYIPYVGLYQLLGLESDYTESTEGIVVVLKDGARKLAILVDEIISQEQVVIKNVKEHMEHVDGIAGATILGDGKVAIILDVASLFRLTKSFSSKVFI